MAHNYLVMLWSAANLLITFWIRTFLLGSFLRSNLGKWSIAPWQWCWQFYGSSSVILCILHFICFDHLTTISSWVMLVGILPFFAWGSYTTRAKKSRVKRVSENATIQMYLNPVQLTCLLTLRRICWRCDDYKLVRKLSYDPNILRHSYIDILAHPLDRDESGGPVSLEENLAIATIICNSW